MQGRDPVANVGNRVVPPSARSCAVLAALAMLLCIAMPVRATVRIPLGDQVDITAVTVEGRTAAECEAGLGHMARQGQALSDATSPPFHLSPGLRAFYDSVIRLNMAGEARTLGQQSSAYISGYNASGEPQYASVVTIVRVEVVRPEGTPAGAASRIAIAWTWLQRLAETRDATTGRVHAQPFMHRFDFSGELVPRHQTWGLATAPCRQGGEGLWFGAVAVWTFLPP